MRGLIDLTGIGLAERGGAKLFETLIAGKCGFLRSLHREPYESTRDYKGVSFTQFLRTPWEAGPHYYADVERAEPGREGEGWTADESCEAERGIAFREALPSG